MEIFQTAEFWVISAEYLSSVLSNYTKALPVVCSSSQCSLHETTLGLFEASDVWGKMSLKLTYKSVLKEIVDLSTL